MIFLKIKNYHFGLHILPPGLHKIGWTVGLEHALSPKILAVLSVIAWNLKANWYSVPLSNDD